MVAPLEAGEFHQLMSAFAPFEASPRLAVAVSGGADSLALTLLANEWASAQGGEILALTVDHGLREESAKEVLWVTEQLSARNIPCRVLTWQGAKPTHGLQAKAREARYRLMSAALREEGILHLLTAHHAEDQDETYRMRLASGSGPKGLAAMAGAWFEREYRLLRPFLNLSKTRLLATLRTRGQSWLEDPSNKDPRFERVRLRQNQGAVPSAPYLGWGQTRDRAQIEIARLAAELVRFDGRGWVWLRHDVLRDSESGKALLSDLLTLVGGSAYGPAPTQLERLAGRMTEGFKGGSTMAGCYVERRGSGWLILRELGRCSSALLKPGLNEWDRRFRITMPSEAFQGATEDGAVKLEARLLGEDGWLEAGDKDPHGILKRSATGLPAVARSALASLWRDGEVVAIPHLAWSSPDWEPDLDGKWVFAPQNPLFRGTFTVV